MRKTFFVLFFILIILKALFPLNKNIQFSHISVEQGLSQSSVTSIYQDRTGFMWFGTFNGLNRYDGINIRIYQANPNDPQSLSHNTVWAICGKEPGFLWIGTLNGLNKLDIRKETFTCYKNIPNDPNSLSGNKIRGLFVDKSGLLWIGTFQKGVNKFDTKTGKFSWYNGPPENPFRNVFSICEDDSGFLWMGTNSGLHRFDPGQEKFICYKDVSRNPDKPKQNTVSSLYYDKNSGMLWVGTAGGLCKFDPGTEEFVRYRHDPNNVDSLSYDVVRDICKDQNNILWIGTAAGLNSFDIREEEFTRYKNDPADPASLSNDFILSVYEDRSGSTWFGTRGGGLNIFARKLRKFRCYRSDPKNPFSLNNDGVWAFTEDGSGAIWIGTERGGLNKFDPDTGMFTHYKHDPENPDSLSVDNIYSLCSSRSGKIWVGTSWGLNEFDPVTGKSIRYLNETGSESGKSGNSVTDDFIISVYEDRSGIVWIGHRFGLDKFDPVNKRFYFFVPDPDSTVPERNGVPAICESMAGILWIGTDAGGLYKFDKEKEEFSKFKSDRGNVKSLNYSISSILEDKEGNLWVGTSGGGLNYINPKTKEITTYTERDGLPINVVQGILEDDQGNLWISTTKGLSRYILTTKTFRNYSQKAGLQSYEFNTGSCYKTTAGEMYFGGNKGFNRFFPDKVIDNMYIPPVVITSVKVTDKSLEASGDLPLQKEVPFDDKVTLSYKDNIFSIEFAALDYTAPEKNHYKCKMEPFNEDWINLGNKNDIIFTNLDPGKYTFSVMGSNHDGIWNSVGASLKVIITPPFWHTWYFRGIMLLFLLGALFGLHKLRTTRIKQDLEKKRLEKELRLKGDFTAMLVHNLRSPLTAIIGYSDMLNEMPDQMDVKKTGQVIHRSSEKMLALINDMLELSKFEAGKMSLERKEIDIVSTVMEIVEIITPLFKKKDIELICKFEPEASKIRLKIDVEKIGQVITNFLSNAAKFTPSKGRVVINALKPVDGFVQVSVTDNGPGVPRDKQEFLFNKWVQINKGTKTKGTGLGLAVSKLIIEAHKGEIGFKPGDKGKGSTFFFKLPTNPG